MEVRKATGRDTLKASQSLFSKCVFDNHLQTGHCAVVHLIESTLNRGKFSLLGQDPVARDR